MPIRDHFHPPLRENPGWESFHAVWLANLVRSLNRRWLPAEYRAQAERHVRADVVGSFLPTVPLYLDVELAVPIELEATYAETCADVRLPELASAA